MKKPDTPNNIPRIIHQLWSGEEKPLPEDLKILSETWKEYHPDRDMNPKSWKTNWKKHILFIISSMLGYNDKNIQR